MRRLILLFGFLLLTLWPAPAYAHHGMVTWECGTHEIHVEQDMTKGRTDSLLIRVDHAAGCHHLIYTTISPAGNGEAQGNAGQVDRCVRYGKEDAVRMFSFAGHTQISADDIKVTCRPWTGGD